MLLVSESKALEAPLEVGGLHLDAPILGVQVEVELDGLAVVADGVKRAAHVVDEQAARSGLVEQEHHAGGLAGKVGQGGELGELDADHALGRGDRLGEGVARRPRGRRLGEDGRHDDRHQREEA
jgi:hypothetical protein